MKVATTQSRHWKRATLGTTTVAAAGVALGLDFLSAAGLVFGVGLVALFFFSDWKS
jgi:hypothetical protein